MSNKKSKYERGRKRHLFIQVPVSVEEKALIVWASHEDGHTWFSTWLRVLALRRAKMIRKMGNYAG